MREVVINTRKQNERLTYENDVLRKQIVRLRRASMHVQTCEHCATCETGTELVELANKETLYA